MDMPTLIICSVVVSLVLLITMLSLYLINRSATYLLYWCFSGLAFACSQSLGALTFFTSVPFWAVPVAANACLMAGHASVLCGVSQLVSRRSHAWVIPLTAVLAVCLHQFPLIMASVENRIFAFYPMILSLTGSAAAMLFTNRNERYGRASMFLFIVMIAYMCQLLLRAWLLLTHSAPLMFLGNDLLQTSGNLFLMGYILLLAISFVIIEMWLRELRLRELANTDSLTGWKNRLALQHRASKLFDEALSESDSLAVIAIDLDRFKNINDQYGHIVGDKALRFVTQRISRVCCRADHRFRLGGEEFVILCPHTSQENAFKIAERIRGVVEECPFTFEGQHINITVSIGVSVSTQADSHWEAILRRADDAMYAAKFEGRNRVKGFDIATPA